MWLLCVVLLVAKLGVTLIKCYDDIRIDYKVIFTTHHVKLLEPEEVFAECRLIIVRHRQSTIIADSAG